MRRKDMEAKARQYGLQIKNESGKPVLSDAALKRNRLIATEEVLAEMAQTNPQNGFVRRAIAAIRTWLRENVPGFEEMGLTDDEIINNYLIPAREFVQKGRTAAPGAMAGAFSRDSRNDIDRELAGLTQSMRTARGPILVKSAAESFIGKPLENAETGIVASVTKQSLGKMLHATAMDYSVSRAAHYEAIANIDKLFRLATKGDSRPGTKETDAMNIAAIHHFDVPMPFKGEILHVEILVKEFTRTESGGNRIYTLQALEIATPASFRRPERLGFPSLTEHPPAGVSDRFAQMVEIVKGEVKPDDAGPAFSRSTTATPANPANPANGLFRDRMDKIVDTLIYNFQDRFKPLRDIQKRAVLVPETQDAVLAEERYSGMVRARTDDFVQDMRDPLIKAIHDEKLDYDAVEEYLHARHAPSRNAAMREINPTEQELKDKTDALTARRDELAKNDDVLVYVRTRRELRDAEADIEDGIADESLGRVLKQEIAALKKLPTVKEYVDAVDKLRALSGVKPFEGDNTALSGMSNAESAKIISEAKKRGRDKALEHVSALVDGITTRTREIITEAGLETPETIVAWSEKYEHYVPLRRDEVGGNCAHLVERQHENVRNMLEKAAAACSRS